MIENNDSPNPIDGALQRVGFMGAPSDWRFYAGFRVNDALQDRESELHDHLIPVRD